MQSWLKLSVTTVRSAGVDSVSRARFGLLTGVLLPPIVFVIAVICSVALFAYSAGAQYTATNLVSNTKLYKPLKLDPNLINGWGLVALPGSPWWLSAQNTSTAPLFSANGSVDPLLVDIPCVKNNSGTIAVPCPFPAEGFIFEPNNPTNPKGSTGIGPFGLFGPTGIVANTFSSAFEVSGAPALFIFATQDGLIVAWNASVSPFNQGVVVRNRFSARAAPLYQGLAIAGPATSPHLYATDLTTVPPTVDVFDKNFALVSTFVPEPNLATTNPKFEPAGPYGIQAIGAKLYITYFSIKVIGGILDVCDLSTSTTKPPCRRLFASNLSGTENAPILATPWGIALAPSDFGPLSNKLLVGNVADGLINAFDPTTGQVVDTLNLTNGSRFSVPGLWGLQFGHGSSANGPTNNLFFSSGPSPVSVTDPVHQYGAGLFGVITP